MEPGKWSVRAGWTVTALVALPFLMSSYMKLIANPQAVAGFEHVGWPPSMLTALGTLEAACLALYLVPRFSVLGAVLLTGYMGGAIATHLRVGEPAYAQCAIGVFVWLGIFLRDYSLQELLPIHGGEFRIEREIVIHQPLAAVFSHLRSLRNFNVWNPFLKLDPKTHLEYRGTDGEVGFVSAWSGDKNVGRGEQELAKIVDGERVEFDLRFHVPMKARNVGYFLTERISDSQTKVVWGMTGRQRFPGTLFVLLFGMEKMVGSKFSEGLRQLKSILESLELAKEEQTGVG